MTATTAHADGAAVQSILDLQDALEALPSSARLSSADTGAIYALARQLAVQGRYETAYRYFSLLTLYKPTDVTYLQGLALCYRMLERYDEALHVYAFLATIDDGNPEHTVAIAECLMLQREFDEALQTVELVLRFCQENAADAADTPAGRRAQVLKERLSQGATAAYT